MKEDCLKPGSYGVRFVGFIDTLTYNISVIHLMHFKYSTLVKYADEIYIIVFKNHFK